jgi:hypothetical protein
VGLPVDHEVLDHDEDGGAPAWQSIAAGALLFYLEELPKSVERRLCILAPGFRLAHREAAPSPHWLNHCAHCNAVLDDQELHCEPGDTFVPISESAGSEIQLTEIHEPFQARAGGYSLATQFLSFARSR